LGQAVEECTVFTDVFKWWERYKDMQTVCYAPKVKYAYGLCEQFKDRGYEAEVIEAGTDKQSRKDAFKRFEQRELRVLVSVDVLREGWDAPVAQCGLDLQPNKQLRTYWQKVGRIKRPYEGQNEAVWLDFAGNFWRFPHPDTDPEWLATSASVSTQDLIKNDREENAEKQPWSCPHCSYSLAPWEKIHGGVCPNCGNKIGKPTRRIRMKNGTMRSVSAIEKPKVKATYEQTVWDKCRYKAYYCDKTLTFARWLYQQETRSWPPPGLKCCPEDPQSGDWNRRVCDVYPWMGRRK
jgi:superfamily II DNA or RNA helicase